MKDWHKLKHYPLAYPWSQKTCTPDELACTRLLFQRLNKHTLLSFQKGKVHTLCHGKKSQCKSCAALPRKMSFMWWKCIRLTGWAEANVSVATGHDAALSTSVSMQPGSFYWALSLVIKKDKAPVAKWLWQKANKDIFLLFSPLFLRGLALLDAWHSCH